MPGLASVSRFFCSLTSQRENLYPSDRIMFHEHCTLLLAKQERVWKESLEPGAWPLGERPWVVDEIRSLKCRPFSLDIVALVCNPDSREAETERLPQSPDQPGLRHSKIWDSLSYRTRPCLKKGKGRKEIRRVNRVVGEEERDNNSFYPRPKHA